MSEWEIVACSDCRGLEFLIRRSQRQGEIRVECANCGAVFLRQVLAR